MDRLKSHLRQFLTLVAIVAGLLLEAVLPLSINQVHASSLCPSGTIFGRNWCTGYFNGANSDVSGSYVFSCGAPSGTAGLDVVNAAQFISAIEKRLNGTSCGGNVTQDENGAAFIIETMRGINGGPASITDAKNHQSDWEDLVNSYDNAGQVKWNINYTYGTCGNGNGYEFTNTLWDSNISDDVFFKDPRDCNTEFSVIFYSDPAKTKPIYFIKKNCGNIVGETVPLPSLDYENTATILGTPIFTGYPDVEPGKTYQVDVKINNSGPASSPDVFLRVSSNNSSLTQDPCGQDPVNCGALDPNGTNPASRGYNTTSCGTGVSPPCYYWEYAKNILTAGTTETVQFQFTVADTAKEPDQLCFTAYAQPENSNSDVYTGNTLCFPVLQPRLPYFTTSSGSEQGGATFGDSPCLVTDPTMQSGSITGSAGETGGKADYIASSGGSISGFGSNGSTFDASLTFANPPDLLGFYGTVCRPDLAKQYLTDNSVKAFTPSDPSNVDVGTIPTSIRKYTGNLQISGTVKVGQRSTLVVDGDVYIKGNISFNQPFGIKTIPSLGLIVTGVIAIDPGVTSIYGIYDTGSEYTSWPTLGAGVINTCRNGFSMTPGANNNPDPPQIATDTGTAACANNLTVNGSLIANNIYFRRTSGNANDSGSSASELINFMPQLFLRPPTGLNGLISQVQYQGERPPIF